MHGGDLELRRQKIKSEFPFEAEDMLPQLHCYKVAILKIEPVTQLRNPW
jgi:hypothetical protein